MTEFPNPTYDDVMSGKAVMVNGVYYHRTHQVCYSQQGVATLHSYASEDAARAAFDAALAGDRRGWSQCPNGYIETVETTSTATVVRFRSKLKSGKPGNLKGVRMLVAVSRPALVAG